MKLFRHSGVFAEKNKYNYFAFYLVKFKVALKNTIFAIFWYWIWVWIYTNYFDNLELSEFKWSLHKHAFPYHSAFWGYHFQKVITYIPGPKGSDKKENYFSAKKFPLHTNKCCFLNLGFWQQSLATFKIWCRGWRGEFGIWESKSVLKITEFSIFVSTSFVKGSGKLLKPKY